MNKIQWYASGFVLLMGPLLSYLSTIIFVGWARLSNDATFAAWWGGNLLLGKACIIGAFVCFMCGIFEED